MVGSVTLKKEILIAICFGLIVGLVITVGMYRARTALEAPLPEDESLVSDPVETLVPSSAPQIQSGFILRQPADELLTSENTLQVTGSTFPQTTIIVLINEREAIGMSDVQGNFSIPVTLSTGANLIRVRALRSGQEPTEVLRSVIYEPAALTSPATSSATTSPTPKANAL